MSFNDLAKKEDALKKASDTNPKPQSATKESPVPAEGTAAQPKS